MRRRLWPLGLAIAQAFCAVRVSAQVSDQGSIFFDAVAFAAEETDAGRVDLFLAVPSTSISFERSGESFIATYRVHLALTKDTRSVHDTTLTRTTSTRSAESASSTRPTYDFFQHRILLPAGSYEARAEIIDPRTSFVSTARRALIVGSYDPSPLSLSGLMLVDRIREDTSGYVMSPRLNDVVSSDGDGFFIFFEAYAADQLEARFDARYLTSSGAVAASRSFERTIPRGRSQQWLRIDAEGVPRGSYTLELRATGRSDTLATLTTSKRTLRVEGSGGIPSGEEELDERIAQLRHVASQEDLEEIRDGRSASEKRRRYAGFWRRLDPTPGTPRNEAMEEYFARIDYAREHYRSYAAGWMTDQGRIYVIYGPPDRVSADNFRSDSRRIETWHYYARGNLEISFEDDSGFGDYRLITPISPLEKYRYGGR